MAKKKPADTQIQDASLAKEFAEQLEKTRTAQGLTQQVVAEKMKISPEMIEKFETAETDFTNLDMFERGYLRNYLDLLSLAHDQFEALMPKKLKMNQMRPNVEDASTRVSPLISDGAGKWLLGLLMVTILVTVIVINL